jgi:hypothetical protein
MLSGAAPLSGHVEEFLRVTSCSTLSQGYGKLDHVYCFFDVWKINAPILILSFQFFFFIILVLDRSH